MEKAYLINLEHCNQCKLIFKANIESHRSNREIQTTVIVKKTDTINTLISECKNKIRETLTNGNVNVFIFQSNKLINGHTLCKHLLQIRNSVKLQINMEVFQLVTNAPFVKHVLLPNHLFVGLAIKPNNLRIINANQDFCSFTWFKSKDKTVWTEIGNKLPYVPKDRDLNCFLKLRCLPVNRELDDGPPYEIVSEEVVQRVSVVPNYCEFMQRQTELSVNDEIDLRVVSYNILSERYADSDKFPYVSSKFLRIDYRMQLVVKEVLGYNGDVVCLQEVDQSIYTSHYKKQFTLAGYKSVFHKKGNRIPEGLVCLYRRSKFTCLKSHQIVLSMELRRNVIFARIWHYVKRDVSLKQVLMEQATSLQVTVLKRRQTNRILIVFNTHLYYRADADQVRLVQIIMIIEYLTQVKREIELESNINSSILLCGDFNSQPNSPVVNYLTRNIITLDGFFLNCKHNYNLQSACGFPNFTNYTDEFKGCLDYIFFNPDEMNVLQSVSFPSEEVLSKEIALPNSTFPSDHIALVNDFIFCT